jgi:hypothetical protein
MVYKRYLCGAEREEEGGLRKEESVPREEED